MRRAGMFAVVLTGCLLLAGCSGKQEEKADYNWTPPIENVSWGQTKEEVLETLGVSEEETEILGGDTSVQTEVVVLKEPLTFLGENAQTSLSFDPDQGLVGITYAFEKDNIITEIIPKLKETYPSETGSTSNSIYGSVPEQMEEEKTEQYIAYLTDHGMSEEQAAEFCGLPLVMIQYDTDSGSPFYNTCRWTATRAAAWEHAAEQAS